MSATIRRLRERQNLTQAEVARKGKGTHGYISPLEAGTKKELGGDCPGCGQFIPAPPAGGSVYRPVRVLTIAMR